MATLPRSAGQATTLTSQSTNRGVAPAEWVAGGFLRSAVLTSDSAANVSYPLLPSVILARTGRE